MANCLVTKLKNVVQNDNLSPFGYVKIASLTGINLTFTRNELSLCNSIGKCKLQGDGYFINNSGQNAGKEMAFAQRQELGPNEGVYINSGTVHIFAPYNDLMTQLRIINGEGSVNLENIRLAFKENEIPSLNVLQCKITGKIENVFKGTYNDIRNTNGPGLTGNMSDANLTYTTVPSYIFFANHPLLEGKVEDMLDKIAATCADGSFDVGCSGMPGVTFTGLSCASNVRKNVTISNHTWSV